MNAEKSTLAFGKLWPLWAATLLVSATAAVILYCFDPSSHCFYPTCLFHQITGLLCPGCGSLRAIHQLLHGHFIAAFRFNPLLILSLPCLFWFSFRCGRASIRGEPISAALSVRWFWLLLALGLALSVWRNVPGTALASLP